VTPTGARRRGRGEEDEGERCKSFKYLLYNWWYVLSPESLMLVPPTTACFCGLVPALHHFLLEAWVRRPKVDFFSIFCFALVGFFGLWINKRIVDLSILHKPISGSKHCTYLHVIQMEWEFIVFCWFRGGVVGIPSKGSQATTSIDPRYLGLGMVLHVNQMPHKPQFQPQLWVGGWIVCNPSMWKYFMLFWSRTYCYHDLQVWKEATQVTVKYIWINLCNILHIHELSCDITKELWRVV
jgi:hypothetical protein